MRNIVGSIESEFRRYRGLRGADWKFLTIPPGNSEEYNKNPVAEKGPS